jgi:hypothetical protein
MVVLGALGLVGLAAALMLPDNTEPRRVQAVRTASAAAHEHA